MRVFISWSGERSKLIAEALRGWIPGVLQAVRPYFSPDDITKCARWNEEISRELGASRIGILILTAENLEAPWLMFESGALAKGLDKSRVCPLLCGIEPADVKGPLVQFQGAKFDREEMWRLLKMINVELGDSALAADVLESVFKMWWPQLESAVTAHLAKPKPDQKSGSRPDRELLEEILSISRSVLRNSHPGSDFPPEPFDDLVDWFARLRDLVAGKDIVPAPIIESLLADMERPLRHFTMYHAQRGVGISPKLMEFAFRATSPRIRCEASSGLTRRSP